MSGVGDIIVAGAGPVGKAAAIEMHRTGYPVTVVAATAQKSLQLALNLGQTRTVQIKIVS